MGSKVAYESIHLSVRSTATPFLYQTRTLASLQWRTQPRLITTTGTRGLGNLRRLAEDDNNRKESSRRPAFKVRTDRGNIDINDPFQLAEGNQGLVIKRTTNIHGPEPSQFDTSGADGKPEITDGVTGSIVRKTWMVPEDLIDNSLVNRREQERLADGEKHRHSVEFDEFGTSDGKEYNSINFSEEVDVYEERDAIDQLTSRMDPDLDRTSTITPSEKQVFQKLFSDIFARQQQAVRNAPPSLDLFKDESNSEADVVLKDKSSATKSVGKIMTSAAKELTKEEMEEMVKRYPVALRAAAARAIGFKLDANADQTENERIGDEAMDLKLEELRKPERERVERLMRAAKTDFELWSVMEKEVFSLIPRLGLGNMKTEPKAKTVAKTVDKKSKNPRKKADIATATTPESQMLVTEPTSTSTEERGTLALAPDEASLTEPSSTTITEDGISALARDGPLYPSHLLLGLRLLDRSFAKPSLLTLSILPKIKSLGLFSHVLGGTTQLYNELMIIHWHRRDDYPAVLALLTEMEQSALDWDKHTLEIISTIDATQKSALRGERGRELNILWSLPAFAPSSFGGWREKIKQAMLEKERETARQNTTLLY